MKMEKIIDRLAERYPSIYAMNWDNPGLQVGKSFHTVKKVMIALDATDHVIQECISWGADLLVTHHPLLLSGIRNITDGNFQGRKILAMVENGIAHYAIHTNYDVLKRLRNRQRWNCFREDDGRSVLRICQKSVRIKICKAVRKSG